MSRSVFGWEYPPGVTGNEPYFNPPEYDEDEVDKRARQFCLNDGQIWLNLPESAKDKYRADAEEAIDLDWVDEQEARYDC